jgi:hypothetical protein
VLNGSEDRATKARHARRITETETKYMRKIAGYAWTDCKTNIRTAKEPSFEHNTGIQKKLVGTQKHNSL